MTSIIIAIKAGLRLNKTRKLYEKLETAVTKKAELQARMEFNRSMANFYTDRVLSIDPHQDWWRFAEAKQKQFNHQEDCTLLSGRIEEAQAVIVAREQELHELLRTK